MWFYYFSKEGFSGYKFAKTKNFEPFIEKAGGEISCNGELEAFKIQFLFFG
jgi:hypothetical protein